MAQRKFRIVKTTPTIAGVCEKCGVLFETNLTDLHRAEAKIASMSFAHKCQSLDSSQNALRVVREATENK
jgi:hypothetical protein